MRVFIAGILTETNTFSPIPVALKAFENDGLWRPPYTIDAPSSLGAISWHAHGQAQARGWQVVDGLLTMAQPGAAVRRDTYESLRDELLAGLQAALPVDAVALNLHGGMVAQGYDDCEGDLIRRVRALVGPDVPVAALLDPHSHLSSEMLESATFLMCYRENPHTDILERSRELLDLLEAAAKRRVTPVMSVFDCHLADVFQTNREPMAGFVRRMRALEGRDGVLDVSIVHGFRRADVPCMGAKVIVTTDARPEVGERLARRLGLELYGMRGQAAQPVVDFDEAIAAALAPHEGLLVLADIADNPGGGSPGDSTYILKALLDGGGTNLAAGMLWDPLAVRFARDAGLGARLTLRIGGKACPLSGPPLDLPVTVMSIIEHGIQRIGEIEVPMGCVVRLQSPAVEVLVAERREQTFSPNLFEESGIDLRGKSAVVVKSAQHYRTLFKPLMSSDLVVDAPGVCTAVVTRMTFHRRPKPMWPWEPDAMEEAK